MLVRLLTCCLLHALAGWIPCLEFAAADSAYCSNDSAIRFGNVSSVSSH